MRAPSQKHWNGQKPYQAVGAPFHVTERHLCFKGGRVKIASTGAEEAASEQGQQAKRFRGDTSASGRR